MGTLLKSRDMAHRMAGQRQPAMLRSLKYFMSSSPLTFRKARREDVVKIVHLIADDPLGAIRENFTDPLPQCYYDAFDAINADPRHELMVAEQNGEVVGTLQLTYLPNMNFRGTWRAWIESVHVATGKRSQGIGAAMMQDAISRAKARHCNIVQLTTHKTRKDAHRFYEKLGFKATHEGMKLHLVQLETVAK